MQENIAIKANIRESFGSASSRRDLKNGLIPATISEKDNKIYFVTIDQREFEKEYFKGSIFSTPLNIDIDKKISKAIVFKIETHPVSDRPIHIDLRSFKDNDIIKSKVKIDFTGKDKSPGIKKGGFLHIVKRFIEILSKSNEIPESIRLNISECHVGDKIKSDQLELPENIKLSSKNEFLIASIIGRGVKKEEEESSEEDTESTIEDSEKSSEEKKPE